MSSTPPMSTNTGSSTSHKTDGSTEHGHIREAIGQSVHDMAEDARMSVVKAIHSAAEKLNGVNAGKWRATEATNSYAHKISAKLEKFSSMLADKDSSEIADDVTTMAKKYRTPLIIGGLAIAYMMLRSGRSNH
jgi:hypothetical protein